ncbi:MAG: hypothetical protein WEB06_10715 [Actinomycetota bacterium]
MAGPPPVRRSSLRAADPQPADQPGETEKQHAQQRLRHVLESGQHRAEHAGEEPTDADLERWGVRGVAEQRQRDHAEAHRDERGPDEQVCGGGPEQAACGTQRDLATGE